MQLFGYPKKKRLSQSDGFTMVDLIVSLTIIVLLAALIIPTYLKYIDIAKKRYVINEARVIYLAAQVRATEYYGEKGAEGYSIPTANDLRDLVGSDDLYEGVTYVAIVDKDKDGSIDRIDYEKENIRVTIEPGNRVTVDGETVTDYSGDTP